MHEEEEDEASSQHQISNGDFGDFDFGEFFQEQRWIIRVCEREGFIGFMTSQLSRSTHFEDSQRFLVILFLVNCTDNPKFYYIYTPYYLISEPLNYGVCNNYTSRVLI